MSCRELLVAISVTFTLSLCYNFCSAQGTQFIFVTNSSRGNDSVACWFGGDANPCKSFSFALEGVHNTSNDTHHPGILIHNGTYELANSAYSVLNGTLNSKLRNVKIVGDSTHNQSVYDKPGVLIQCKKNAGLTFFNIPNVTIERVQFSGCGALQLSTTISTTNNFTVTHFQVGLFLVLCENILFQEVWVEKTAGTGVVIYASTGYNRFEHCWFQDNRYNESDMQSYPGGGLYLEFPYCVPTFDGECDTDLVEGHVSNSYYLFQDCHMRHNSANVNNLINDTFILPHAREHLAFGRGGGFSVFFKGAAANNSVVITQSSFMYNEALWGAGVFAEFQDNTTNNSFQVQSSILAHNYCPYQVQTGGGGTRFGYVFFETNHVRQNSIRFDGCTFTNNSAYFGGGVSFYTSPEPGTSYATNALTLSNCSWFENTARVGAALDLSIWHAVSNGLAVHVMLNDITVGNHTAASNLQDPGAVVGLGALYIDTLPVQFSGYTHFHDNYHTALAAIHAQMDFSSNCTANFTDNFGRNGGAIALFGSSFIRAHNGTCLSFTRNNAQFRGGAIFSQRSGDHNLLSSRNCFIRYENISVTPQIWMASFQFINNTASSVVNSIHTTTITPCLWGGAFGEYNQTSINEVFCWSKRWQYSSRRCPPSETEKDTSGEIKTDPGEFNCTCVNCSIANCSMIMYPGERKELPLSTTDDLGNSATDRTVLIAYSQNSSTSSISNTSKYIADNSLKLYGKPNSAALIDIYTQDPRVLYTTVNVKLIPCPTGFIHNLSVPPNEAKCICYRALSYKGLIECSRSGYTASLKVKGIWLGIYDETSLLVAGYSPYTFNLTKKVLPKKASDLSKHLCQTPSNRNGTLCGACISGYSPAINAHNFDCKKCDAHAQKYAWILFLLTEMLPQTILFAILVLFNVSLTSGPANGFILFAQMISACFALYAISTSPYNEARKIYVVFYDIWNLNFFDPYISSYCLSPTMKTATLISLDYLIAFYPLILISVFFLGHQLFKHGRIIYCLCLPLVQAYKRLCQRYDLRPGSSVHALTAFLLLSYTKFTMVSFRLLTPATLYNASGHHKARVMFYDGTIPYFHQEHIPYVVTAAFVLAVFVALPPLILITYPIKCVGIICRKLTCNQLGNKDHSGRVATEFRHILNSFYGCYKDGSGETYDLRWFAGLYFGFRIIFALLNSLNSVPWNLQYTVQQLVCTLFIFIVAIVRPYKRELYNYVDIAIFTILAAVNALSHYNFNLAEESEPSKGVFVVECILIWIPLVYMVGYIITYGCIHYWKRKQKGRVPVSSVGLEEEDDHISDDSIIQLVDNRDGPEDGHLRSGSVMNSNERRRGMFPRPHIQNPFRERKPTQQEPSHSSSYGATNNKSSDLTMREVTF